MDYLGLREQYRLAYHRWDNCQRQLCELFGCDFADLEQKLLEAYADGRYRPMIQRYAQLGNELDQASDRWDAAQLCQARKAATAHLQVNKDFQALEC